MENLKDKLKRGLVYSGVITTIATIGITFYSSFLIHSTKQNLDSSINFKEKNPNSLVYLEPLKNELEINKKFFNYCLGASVLELLVTTIVANDKFFFKNN